MEKVNFSKEKRKSKLWLQNNYKIKSPTVEFFSHEFLSAPPGFELTTPRFEVQRATMEPKGKGYFCKKILSLSSVVAHQASNLGVVSSNPGGGRQKFM